MSWFRRHGRTLSRTTGRTVHTTTPDVYVFHAEGETDIDTELYPFGEFCYEVTPGGRLERDPEFVCVVDEYTVTADDADEALGKASIMRLTPGTEPASRVDVVPG